MFDLCNCFVLQTTEISVLTKYTFESFIIKFQNNVFITEILLNIVFVFAPIRIKILNNQQRIE
jgi:hypothetical protein